MHLPRLSARWPLAVLILTSAAGCYAHSVRTESPSERTLASISKPSRDHVVARATLDEASGFVRAQALLQPQCISGNRVRKESLRFDAYELRTGDSMMLQAVIGAGLGVTSFLVLQPFHSNESRGQALLMNGLFGLGMGLAFPLMLQFLEVDPVHWLPQSYERPAGSEVVEEDRWSGDERPCSDVPMRPARSFDMALVAMRDDGAEYVRRLAVADDDGRATFQIAELGRLAEHCGAVRLAVGVQCGGLSARTEVGVLRSASLQAPEAPLADDIASIAQECCARSVGARCESECAAEGMVESCASARERCESLAAQASAAKRAEYLGLCGSLFEQCLSRRDTNSGNLAACRKECVVLRCH